jgi:two-component system phosphate regulon response regulator PhoB
MHHRGVPSGAVTDRVRRILVVEDDPDIRHLLLRLLEREGYEVLEVNDALGAMEQLGAGEPDLVLLDIGLPDVDGMELLGRIRARSTVPVIMLTGRAAEDDRIAGLRGGADDYIAKPFSAGELIARVESVLRRSVAEPSGAAGPAAGTLQFEGLEIDPGAREVRVGDEVVPVTAKEFDLLAFLAAAPRQVFSREQLLRNVWESSGQWQDDATVTEHVRRVRRKIEADPDRPRWLVTVRGVGYRFEP